MLILASTLYFLIYTQNWRINAFLKEEETKKENKTDAQTDNKEDVYNETIIIEGNTYL